ncbi:isochorismatase family protein [Streptomyces antimicrobicus]|uniref:isochorismatase family protein n=1 Tax=Streptomyces antimicrobicus TaxID=2883108 RepID=UPI0027E1E579|nr:isochorismatase family protein [Streptomyces antimicrobicus]
MAGIPDTAAYPMPGCDDLPQNTATWTPDPQRAVLLVHDMQKYFLRPFAQGRSPLTELTRNAIRLREVCAQLGVPVAYTVQPGGMSPERRGLLKDFWGPGMTIDPAHRGVAEGLGPRPRDWVLTKWRYSAFHRTDLLAKMRLAGRDQLIICGVYAHIGILMTAGDAFTQDIQAFLAADAMADFSAAEHRMALDYAAGRCAVVATTRRLAAELTAAATAPATASSAAPAAALPTASSAAPATALPPAATAAPVSAAPRVEEGACA